MIQQLSSRITFVQKFIFPALWLSGFGTGTLAMFLGSMRDKRGMPVPPAMRFLFLAMLVIGGTFIIFISRKLKKVSIAEDRLLVSNYFTEIAIPLSQISGVMEHRFQKGNPVTVSLRTPSLFGSKIFFIPKMGFKFGQPHAVAEMLRKLAGLKEEPK